MWKDLTGAPCLGNTFTDPIKYTSALNPDYLTSGQPCPDYSRSGSQQGYQGDTGWMFVDQTAIILLKKPSIFRLEISDFALQVNSGREVKEVISRLSAAYDIQWKLMKVWKFGDPTNRTRLIIIGTRTDVNQQIFLKDIKYEFPQSICDQDNAPRIIDTAVLDSEVPERFWIYDDPKRLEWQDPQGGKMHMIARSGSGMGHSRLPHSVQSYYYY
jgi:site-specific DNA-cytosine methylase